ncbi:hypothetical protein JDV02_006526 [Purpureocillium takamizusanense]|uniref:DUF1308 domain-containing protein n=1 Tax=Purpureocillium takamizusanense TaxID=2060973 RepID=A0A9Q8QIG8_9HYPO|nr:uncharacterized protein JDV02_006526 [Purpureocillium takamizusanense]UNI20438.1 hypothetical protein JDV02_006526 [Purpureocillium takamizusanense]
MTSLTPTSSPSTRATGALQICDGTGQAATNAAGKPTSSNCATTRHAMLQTAKDTLAVLQPLADEVGLLLDGMRDRVKSVQTTGLPALLRDLNKTQLSLEQMRSDLATPLDDPTLKALGRRLEVCTIDASHGRTKWDIIKRCKSLVAVNQSFQGSDRDARKREIARMAGLRGREKQRLHRTLKELAKIQVDVVDRGAEWLDVRTLQPDRLARQMTDSGWGWGEHSVGDDIDPSEWEDVPLARQVRRLAAAALMNRHEYRVPRVRVVLTNISRRTSNDVDAFLGQLSRIDPAVQVVFEDQDGDFLQQPSPPLTEAIKSLLGSELDGLTQTLNLDHTVLVDLISDITHLRLQPQPWQEETTRTQIVEENQSEGGVMARTLYPILDGRTLVCTKEAAEHFHEVLKTVGTSTERERGRLLVPFDDETRLMSDAAHVGRGNSLTVRATIYTPAPGHGADARPCPRARLGLALDGARRLRGPTAARGTRRGALRELQELQAVHVHAWVGDGRGDGDIEQGGARADLHLGGSESAGRERLRAAHLESRCHEESARQERDPTGRHAART